MTAKRNKSLIGTINEDGHEVYPYHVFEEHEKVRSPLVPGAHLDVATGFLCPRCGTKNEPLRHGHTCVCQCGLTFALFGDGLHVYREEPS